MVNAIQRYLADVSRVHRCLSRPNPAAIRRSFPPSVSPSSTNSHANRIIALGAVSHTTSSQGQCTRGNETRALHPPTSFGTTSRAPATRRIILRATTRPDRAPHVIASERGQAQRVWLLANRGAPAILRNYLVDVRPHHYCRGEGTRDSIVFCANGIRGDRKVVFAAFVWHYQ